MHARASLLVVPAAVLVGIGLWHGVRSSADASNSNYYNFKELPLPNGAKSPSVRKMGADGTIFGGAIFPDNSEIPGCWRGGMFIPALLLNGYNSGEVMDGNVHGDKVGYQFRSDGPPQAVWWLADDKSPRLLDAPNVYSSANAINDSGGIVGSHLVGGTYTACFFGLDGKTLDFKLKAGVQFSDGQADNNGSVVAGILLDFAGKQEVFVLPTAGAVNLIDPPAPFTQGQFAGLNDHGQVAGTWMSPKPGDPTIAFTYDSIVRQAKELSTPAGYDSAATGINGTGKVTGYVQQRGSDPLVPTLWPDPNTMLNLQDLVDPQTGIKVLLPFGISDAGQIVVAVDIAGKERVGTLSPAM